MKYIGALVIICLAGYIGCYLALVVAINSLPVWQPGQIPTIKPGNGAAITPSYQLQPAIGL